MDDIMVLVSNRYLVRRKWRTKLYEVKFLEISPSGSYIKLRDMETYNENWDYYTDLYFVEELRR